MDLLSSGIRLQVGLWVDDLRVGLRSGLKWASNGHLDVIGLDAFGAEVRPNVLSETGRRNLKHKIGATGAALTAIRADVGGRRLADPATLDRSIERLHAACSLGRALGARLLVAPLGYVPAKADSEDQASRRMVSEGLKAAIALTTNAGLRLTVLPGSESSEELAVFLKDNDPSEFVGVDLNPGLFVSRGTDPLKALQNLATRVCLATVTDFYRGGGEAAFGAGDVSWGDVLVGLSSFFKNGPLALLAACSRECNRVEALTSAIEILKKLRLNPFP